MPVSVVELEEVRAYHYHSTSVTMIVDTAVQSRLSCYNPCDIYMVMDYGPAMVDCWSTVE